MREIGSGTEHCPFDWLAVYDGKDDSAPLIGKFCGVGKFPFSIIGKCYIWARETNSAFNILLIFQLCIYRNISIHVCGICFIAGRCITEYWFPF